jgi:hypothetical protein
MLEADLRLRSRDVDGRMNKPKRCFWAAKTVSTAERTFERAALAFACNAVNVTLAAAENAPSRLNEASAAL